MIGKHELTEEMMEDDVSIPNEEDESLWGTYLANCQGASGVEDLYNNCDNDEYVIYDFYSQTLPNCLIGPSLSKLERISAEDHDVLLRHACKCPGELCLQCKSLSPRLRQPSWMLDSGASNHFTPLMSDFITYSPFPSPERVGTAANSLSLPGSGTVLIEYEVEDKGKVYLKTLRLQDVMYVPKLMQCILSLGQFLKEGMCVYGNDTMITLLIPGNNIPVMQCVPQTHLGTIYWLMAKLAKKGTLHNIFKEDYDLMHQCFGHPSKEVLH